MPSILVTMCLIHKMKHIFPPIRNTAQKTPEQAPGADGYIDIVPDEHSSTPDVVDAPADELGEQAAEYEEIEMQVVVNVAVGGQPVASSIAFLLNL